MTYGDFKNLPRRTIADKILRDKALNIAKNPKYDRYQHGLASVVCNFLIDILLIQTKEQELVLKASILWT